jgi:hypothetical protein
MSMTSNTWGISAAPAGLGPEGRLALVVHACETALDDLRLHEQYLREHECTEARGMAKAIEMISPVIRALADDVLDSPQAQTFAGIARSLREISRSGHYDRDQLLLQAAQWILEDATGAMGGPRHATSVVDYSTLPSRTAQYAEFPLTVASLRSILGDAVREGIALGVSQANTRVRPPTLVLSDEIVGHLVDVLLTQVAYAMPTHAGPRSHVRDHMRRAIEVGVHAGIESVRDRLATGGEPMAIDPLDGAWPVDPEFMSSIVAPLFLKTIRQWQEHRVPLVGMEDYPYPRAEPPVFP